jgi:hypothetical protein
MALWTLKNISATTAQQRTYQAGHAAQVHRPPLQVGDVDEQHDGNGIEALAQVALQAFQHLYAASKENSHLQLPSGCTQPSHQHPPPPRTTPT